MKNDLRRRHPFSYKTGKERVTVSLFVLQKKEEKVGIDSGIVGTVFKLVLSGVQELLTSESVKYVQQYKGSVGVLDFFKDDGKTMTYDGIEIMREVQLEESNSEKNVAAVFAFLFDKQNNNKKVFRLIPLKPVVNFSKCKTPRMKGTIDVKLKVVLEAVWISEGDPKRQVVSEDEFIFSNIKLTGPNTTRESPRSPFESDIKGAWIPFFPKEAALNVRCEVVESDEFGKRLEQINTLLKDNKDSVSALFSSDSKEK